MKKLESFFSIIGVILIGAVIIFFAVKGMILHVWMSPAEPITYAIHGIDDRNLKVIFLPDNEGLFWYQDESIEEVVHAKLRGSYGTHYFWRLWKIEGPHISIGYRIYPSDVKPITMEIETIQKHIIGNGIPSFSKVGDTTYSTLLFGRDRLKFEGMWLKKEQTNTEFVSDSLKLSKR